MQQIEAIFPLYSPNSASHLFILSALQLISVRSTRAADELLLLSFFHFSPLLLLPFAVFSAVVVLRNACRRCSLPGSVQMLHVGGKRPAWAAKVSVHTHRASDFTGSTNACSEHEQPTESCPTKKGKDGSVDVMKLKRTRQELKPGQRTETFT